MRGDLYRLRSDKNTTGHEQRGPRYAVAIQSDGILLSTLVVAPTSTSAQPAIFRPEIEMEGVRTRVLIDQMRAVDASRLGELAGRLDAAETGEVDRAIRLMLGILYAVLPDYAEGSRVKEQADDSSLASGFLRPVGPDV